jgi:hypothetical protein
MEATYAKGSAGALLDILATTPVLAILGQDYAGVSVIANIWFSNEQPVRRKADGFIRVSIPCFLTVAARNAAIAKVEDTMDLEGISPSEPLTANDCGVNNILITFLSETKLKALGFDVVDKEQQKLNFIVSAGGNIDATSIEKSVIKFSDAVAQVAPVVRKTANKPVLASESAFTTALQAKSIYAAMVADATATPEAKEEAKAKADAAKKAWQDAREAEKAARTA